MMTNIKMCPKCLGMGCLPSNPYSSTTMSAKVICDKCNGYGALRYIRLTTQTSTTER